jgi:cyclin-dependent kinase 7
MLLFSFPIKLLDVFGHKSNVSLVFDFMETDLEVMEIWFIVLYCCYFALSLFYIVVFVIVVVLCCCSAPNFALLQVIVKDTSIMLTPAHIKSFILMTLQGLEYLHLNWILHRVSQNTFSINTRMFFCTSNLGKIKFSFSAWSIVSTGLLINPIIFCDLSRT